MAGISKSGTAEGGAAPSAQRAHQSNAAAPGMVVRPIRRNAVASVCAGCGIRHIANCAALNDYEIGDLESIMSHRQLGPNQLLALEGDKADYAYNVISGALKIYKSLADGRTQIVGFLLPGDFLGLPQRGTYAYSAETLGTTELCQFPRTALTLVFAKHEQAFGVGVTFLE